MENCYLRSDGKYSRPNKWVIFRVQNGGLGKSMRQLRMEYKKSEIYQTDHSKLCNQAAYITHGGKYATQEKSMPLQDIKKVILSRDRRQKPQSDVFLVKETPEIRHVTLEDAERPEVKWKVTRQNIEKYYNLHVLDGWIANERDSFLDSYSVDLKKKHGAKRKSTLLNMITNYRERYSNGPLRWLFPTSGGTHSFEHVFSEKYKKSIYLIGESHESLVNTCHVKHGKDQKTVPIEQYFKQLVEKTTAFLDIFIEQPLLSSPKVKQVRLREQPESKLEPIMNVLRPYTKYAQSFKHTHAPVRVHMTDIRFDRNLYSDVQFLSYCLQKIIQSNPEAPSDYSSLSVYSQERLVDMFVLAKESPEKFISACLTKEKHLEREKQWKNTPELDSWLLHNVNQLIREDAPPIDAKRNFTDSMSYCLLELGKLFMDFYTLRRMLQTFDTSQDVVAKEQPLECHQIVYYAGGAHVDNVAKFLVDRLHFTVLSSHHFGSKSANVNPCPTDCFKNPEKKECGEWFCDTFV